MFSASSPGLRPWTLLVSFFDGGGGNGDNGGIDVNSGSVCMFVCMFVCFPCYVMVIVVMMVAMKLVVAMFVCSLCFPGNSVRGVKFSQLLTEMYSFHIFDTVNNILVNFF